MLLLFFFSSEFNPVQKQMSDGNVSDGEGEKRN